MKGQHELIKGYRDLTPAEIQLINDIKQKAEEVRALIDHVTAIVGSLPRDPNHIEPVESAPMRWVAEARTDLQKGFMCLVRAVARPESF